MGEEEQRLRWYAEKALDERRHWYSSAVEAYDRVRPRYPESLVQRAVALAKLAPGAQLLELGCGPGTATVTFARLGFALVCLEPNAEFCARARENCASYGAVEIRNLAFEEWEPQGARFDAVIAATSFHWIPEDIRNPKTIAVLKAGGALVLLWNTAMQPTPEVHASFLPVYEQFAPKLARYETGQMQEENIKSFGQSLLDSHYFKELHYEQCACTVEYDAEEYAGLLSTYSPYLELEPERRAQLFTGLQEVIAQQWAGRIALSYLSALHVAHPHAQGEDRES